MLQQLRDRMSENVDNLRLWHDSIHASRGPESSQSLFWDLIDPEAAATASPHAFQREKEAAIESRCDKLRVRTAVLPPVPVQHRVGSAAAAPLPPAGIDVAIGSASDSPNLKVQRRDSNPRRIEHTTRLPRSPA